MTAALVDEIIRLLGVNETVARVAGGWQTTVANLWVPQSLEQRAVSYSCVYAGRVLIQNNHQNAPPSGLTAENIVMYDCLSSICGAICLRHFCHMRDECDATLLNVVASLKYERARECAGLKQHSLLHPPRD